MVAFSRFPAALAAASEIYSNLDTAVRAAKANDRGPMVISHSEQMARLDASTTRQLDDLRKALDLVGDAVAADLETDASSSPTKPFQAFAAVS